MHAEPWLRLCVLCFAAAAPSAARAWCQSTTCNPELESCELDEHGCPVTGEKLAWAEPCVTFWVPEDPGELPGVDPETLRSATLEAFARWNEVLCGAGERRIDLHLAGALECALTGYDPDAMQNVNTLRVVHEDWPHPGGLTQVALTTVTSIVRTGQILDADIELNAEQNVFTTGDIAVETDLVSALVHEAGHALGLAHSDDPDATMYWHTRPGDIGLRTLSPDDLAGICAIYPPSSGPACSRAPASDPDEVCRAVVTPRSRPRARSCSAGIAGPSAPAGSGWGALGLGALLAAVRLRVRR